MKIDPRTLGKTLGFCAPFAALAGCVDTSAPPLLEAIFLRPTAEVKGSPADYGYAYDEKMLEVEPGREISVWHVHAEDPKAIVVIIPGSDRNKSRYLIGLPVFVPNGYDVVLMDYEGFGASPGRPTLENLVDDAFTAVSYAKTQHEKVIAFGISTGGPSATRVAADLDLTGVLYEAPLLIQREAELWLRDNNINVPLFWQVGNAFTTMEAPEEFDILKYVARVTEPKMIMHSSEDDVSPFSAGAMIYDAAASPKEFWEMRGGHGKMIELDPEAYTARVVGWLDKVCQ